MWDEFLQEQGSADGDSVLAEGGPPDFRLHTSSLEGGLEPIQKTAVFHYPAADHYCFRVEGHKQGREFFAEEICELPVIRHIAEELVFLFPPFRILKLFYLDNFSVFAVGPADTCSDGQGE